MSLNTYIALLRGINVVGRNKLPMKDLARLFEALGYEHVRTYIQSGNVVFRSRRKCSARAGRAISSAVEAEFGFRPAVLIIERRDLESALEGNPYPTEVGKALHIFFLESDAEEPNINALENCKLGTEQFRLDGRVFYLYTPDGFANSKIGGRVERCLGVAATARNLNTVKKLIELSET